MRWLKARRLSRTPKNKESVVSLQYVKHRQPLKLVMLKTAANIIKDLVPVLLGVLNYLALMSKKENCSYCDHVVLQNTFCFY